MSRFWIQAWVISPSSPQTCSGCGIIIEGMASLLLRLDSPIENEDPKRSEPGGVVIEKLRCGRCREKEMYG